MTPDEIEAARLVIDSGGRLSLVDAAEFLRQERSMEKKPAGCTGACADQAPCVCSHNDAPRRPHQAPIQFCGHAKRAPLLVRVWRYLTGPRAF